MQIKENLIVSLTSWTKRIGNVITVLRSLMSQTLLPNKIILNLCTEDFPEMENDLPEDLLSYINEHSDIIEIYWFIENYKSWKKHLHVLEIASDDDLIICADDDHLYPSDYIEKMYVAYCYYNKQFPITLNKIMLVHNVWTFNGPGTLYRKSDWGNYKKFLTKDLLYHAIDDTFITILFAMNNVLLVPIPFTVPSDEELLYNDIDGLTDRQAPIRHNAPKEEVERVFTNYKVFYDNTFVAIEDTLRENYFKGAKVEFSPLLWNIINSCVKHYYTEYDMKKLPYAIQWSLKQYYENYLNANLYHINYKSLRLDLPRSSNLSDYIGENNKLVVTLASWPGRADNIVPVINTILENTIQPTEIIINLALPDWNLTNSNITIDEINESSDETLSKLKPLISLIKDNPSIKIIWHEDEKVKSWKKHLYAIKNYQKDDVIICIDDDILYSPVFIETMIKSYNYYGRKYPISTFSNCFCQGGYAFCGYSTLYTPHFFRDFDKYISKEILYKFPEDNHLLNILNINNNPIMPVIGSAYLYLNQKYNEGESNFGNLNFSQEWWDSYSDIIAESSRIIDNVCSDREEMRAGWKPNYFNFSILNLKKFLEEEQSRKDEYPFSLVYESVKKHIEVSPGNSEELTDLASKLEYVII